MWFTNQNKDQSKFLTSPGLAWPGSHSGARLWIGACRRTPGDEDCSHGTRLGAARDGDVGLTSRRLTTRRKIHEGQKQSSLGGSRGKGAQRPNFQIKPLAIRTWNVTSLGEKEPELERYWLEIVRLTTTHSMGSGTQVLERALRYPGVAQQEWRWAGVTSQPPSLATKCWSSLLWMRRLFPCAFRLGTRLLLLFESTDRPTAQST